MEFNSKWNVIEENDFKNAVTTVFEDVSGALSKTLGPYGTTTIIEKFGEMHVSKDGFQVLKSISYKDPVLSNILMLLFRISAQVVIQVGDGSTSSIIAANEIIKKFNESGITSQYRPKELIDKITKCVDKIVEKLYANAIKIDPNDNEFIQIKNIASVATNGDTEIAEMIADIYRQTNNPVIKYVKSKTNETKYEIIDGYQADYTYIDTIFATQDDGTCKINGAHIIMFDRKVDMEDLEIISEGAKKAVANHERVVIFAPAYDGILLNHLKQTLTLEFKSRGTTTCVYCRADLINNMKRNMFNDFAVMCGASVIREQYGDERIKVEDLGDYIGHVQYIEIGEKSTLIKGFDTRSDEMYKQILLDAEIMCNKAEESYRDKGLVDTGLSEVKNRLTKLKCSMGTIHVGGDTTLAKAATYDLVEDAVRACESAYMYGYNIGGSRSIVYAIDEILNECDETEDFNIYNVIKGAFINVFKRVLLNKYGVEKIDEEWSRINDKLMSSEIPVTYDIINETVSTDIINSCRTDIEILRGALSVISLILTSNQYISITTQ